MQRMTWRLLAIWCLVVAVFVAPTDAESQAGILEAIPGDAVGFAVIHHLSDVSQRIAEFAKIVQAPAPDLLALAKQASGVGVGLDEQGDLAIVFVGSSPSPKGVVLVPVANFAEFFKALHVEEPATGVVEVQLVGGPKLVGRKGNFAAISATTDRDALEQLIASTTNLAADTSLAEWLDANQASAVVTASGVKQLAPKLMSGIVAAQEGLRQTAGEQGKTAADSLEMYKQLLAAAEPEVDQFGIALRIDASNSVELLKRIQFTPGGALATWAANVKPFEGDFLAGLQGGPFVMAMDCIVPPGSMERLMNFSVEFMQKNPMYHFSPEQAKQYAALSAKAMSGVRSFQMLMGVSEPGTGLYGNMTAVMKVDSAASFLDQYEQTLTAMRSFVEEAKVTGIPVGTTRRIHVGDHEGLEVSMDLSQMKQVAPPGGPDPQKIMKLMMGHEGEMKIYLAPADGHTVVTSYASQEQLQSAIDFYNSKQAGFAADPNVAKVAAMLPPGSQLVAFVSLEGATNVVRQFSAAMTPVNPLAAVPEIPASPPIGIAAKVTAAGAEGDMIVTSDTLRAIGEVVAKVRAAATGARAPQP